MSNVKEVSFEEVAQHNTPDDAWVVISGRVYNVTKFAKFHPGGSKLLLDFAGQDATKDFNYFHAQRVMDKYGPKLYIGDLKDREEEPANPFAAMLPDTYGELVPFGDPSWYQGWRSPYYTDSHKKFRKAIREFMDAEVTPNIGKWLEAEDIPKEVITKMAKIGFLQSCIKGVWNKEYFGDVLPGGVRPEEFNWFHFIIAITELSRGGSLGFVWATTAGINIGLAPVLNFGAKHLKDLVAADCANGRKYIALAITEPWAGSDVSALKTSAKLTPDGKHYIVNGIKKWITNGTWANYYTTAVRTGGEGMGGISLLLIDRSTPGISVKKMKCQGVLGSGTAFIVFEDVKVPVDYRIGDEGKGFKYIMKNFNTERFYIVLQALAASRLCYEDAFKYAHKRKTFGKKLIDHPVIRNKLAHMARQIEPIQSWTENTANQLNQLSASEQVKYLAGSIALMKAHSTIVFEYCTREAIQIFGGAGYTRGGQGERVERLHRDVRGVAIPGGSEEILLDLGVRQAQKLYPAVPKL